MVVLSDVGPHGGRTNVSAELQVCEVLAPSGAAMNILVPHVSLGLPTTAAPQNPR